MVDLIVLGAVVIGAFAGWRRGFIMPLVAVGTMLVGLYALYAGPGAGVVPSGTAGIGLGVLVVAVAGSLIVRVGSLIASLVYHFAILKAADRTFGIPLGAATALVSVYLGLVAVVSFDNLIAPLHGTPTVDQAAVAAVRAAVQANPQFGVMLDPATLEQLATEVAATAIPAEEVARIEGALGFYMTTVRPALVQSSLAPAILAVGERVPFIGRAVVFPTE